MKVFGSDIGCKNLAYCIFNINDGMIDIILGIIATLICGIGYGTIYFFTAVFWLFVIGKILEHYAVPVEVKVMNDVKGREEEKT